MSAISPDAPSPPVPLNGAQPPDAGTSSPRGGEQGEPTAEVVPAAAADQVQPASMLDGGAEAEVVSASAALPQPPRKGPLSFLSGALTSGLLAWLCLGLSQKVVGYYALHPPHYEARVAQSIATALKTMIVGMSFLATFSFAFVGLGLVLVFLRSLLPARPETPA